MCVSGAVVGSANFFTCLNRSYWNKNTFQRLHEHMFKDGPYLLLTNNCSHDQRSPCCVLF